VVDSRSAQCSVEVFVEHLRRCGHARGQPASHNAESGLTPAVAFEIESMFRIVSYLQRQRLMCHLWLLLATLSATGFILVLFAAQFKMNFHRTAKLSQLLLIMGWLRTQRLKDTKTPKERPKDGKDPWSLDVYQSWSPLNKKSLRPRVSAGEYQNQLRLTGTG